MSILPIAPGLVLSKSLILQHLSILAQHVGLALRSINNQAIQVPTDVSALSCLTGFSVGPYAGEARSSFLDRYFCLTNLSSLQLGVKFLQG